MWKQDHINHFKLTRPGYLLKSVQKIVMHYTANPGATAENHQDYFDREDHTRYASAHIFVDNDSAVEIIPLNELAYHAGNEWWNYNSLGIELCVEKDGSFHPNTIKQATSIVAELCRRYSLDPKTDIVRHYDVTGKICPKPWVENPILFTQFKGEVSNLLGPKIIRYVTGGFPDGSDAAKAFEAFMNSRKWYFKKEDA